MHEKSTAKGSAQSPSSAKSPLSKFLQGKNLTGTARHIRDLAADVHGNIQQWNNLTLEGLTILKSITQEKYDENYSNQLQEFCDKLENICEALSNVVRNISQLTQQAKIMATLHKSPEKLFATWPVSKFGDTVDFIYKAYNNEIQVKYKVLENIAHCHTESWKMLHLAAWIHQPFLSDNLTILLESMLTETGHR